MQNARLLVRRTALHTPAQARARAWPLAAADDQSNNEDGAPTVALQACRAHPTLCSEALAEIKPGMELEE